MTRIGVVLSIFGACSVSMAFAEMQTTPSRLKLGPRHPRRAALANPPRFATVPSPQWPASATSNVIPATCPPEATGAVCGYVKVPLDREHPNRGKIRIYFELYPHSGSGPAESAILGTLGGGGGLTSTGVRGFFLPLYAANLDAHDLLLIDGRGRGLSDTIDCEELQHALAPLDQAEKDCAAQLGEAASRYGTGDLAQDTEAVRAALGYEKVDYHGGSYGGTDVTAYATRFGEHLRSIVLDAPFGTPDLDAFAYARHRTHAIPRVIRLGCQRSPTCSPDHPDPDAELGLLTSAIRHHPVEGEAYDAGGNLVHVRIDENALLNYIAGNVTGNFVNTGEVLAAGRSLLLGDPKPLLRLGAEGSFALLSDAGDPTFFSTGASYAVACADFYAPWDWSAPISTRMAQYARAVSALPSNAFAPFSKAAATGLLFSFPGRQCLWWEKPTPSSPVAPRRPTYPQVPTLVLTGDMDAGVPLEATRKVAALFPNSTFVTIPEAGHEASFWSQCARDLASQFIGTLQVGDASCADAPEVVFPAVGRFPLFASQGRAADVDPNGSNQIGLAERKVVTVAVAAATDALQRSLIGFSSDGVGLRAGTFHNDFGEPAWTLTLTGCAFSGDVTVDGTVIWRWGVDSSLVADLRVSGPGTQGGTLHVEGAWQAAGPVGQFRVSGVLGGRQVEVLVPEA
jgi:pimeloyl-ACP methyl ester carboxylesterase